MIELKRILLPTDFSESSQTAVRYAKAFAETFHASLHVLHVVEDPFLYYPASEISVPPLDYRRQMEQSAREQLNQIMTDARRAGIDAQLALRVGSPFVEIIRYAKTESIDLILMGSLGLGPIGHMLMGSVAENVVRKAPCPVLTVRHPEHEFVLP